MWSILEKFLAKEEQASLLSVFSLAPSGAMNPSPRKRGGLLSLSYSSALSTFPVIFPPLGFGNLL